jgi:CRP-like cAMP-binding protein
VTIVREGDPADHFYIIESGHVEGTQFTPQGEMHVRTMQPGEYVGQAGLLATRTRTCG